MTIQEASERYNIPMEILREYESWGLCGEIKKIMGSWQYDDTDLERLSLIMTLHDIGFESSEIEAYMRLREQEGTDAQRMRMLNQNAAAHWMRFTSVNVSWNGWIIFAFISVNKPLIQISRRNKNENPRQKHI